MGHLRLTLHNAGAGTGDTPFLLRQIHGHMDRLRPAYDDKLLTEHLGENESDV